MFNTVEPENKKVKLSWSNIRSNSLLWSNLKPNASSWSNIKLDETSNIKEKNNNTTSLSNKLVPQKIDNREKITTNENKEKPWNLKFIEQVTAIDLSGLKCYLRDEWREEGKCIEIPFAEKRLNAQIQAIERAVNYRFELDKIYKRK